MLKPVMRILHATVPVLVTLTLLGAVQADAQTKPVPRDVPLPPSAPPAPPAPPVPPAPPDVAAPPADAQTSVSGLAWKVLQPGTGDKKPGPTDMATFHYSGWTANGALFDSTTRRQRPSTLFVDRVMPGLSEALQMMVVGEKRRVWLPEKLGFNGQKDRPAGPLCMEVELVAFEPSPRVPPDDVMAPPASATKTASGLAYRVLKQGPGGPKPRGSSRVRVHYTGWMTDGQMFDSSVVRGEPIIFGLDQVISGWTEGVQLMSVGDKFRFWIPSRLAYNNEPGKPRGMLVFDVELLGIEK
jgi:peptidylprolyl isomerase